MVQSMQSPVAPAEGGLTVRWFGGPLAAGLVVALTGACGNGPARTREAATGETGATATPAAASAPVVANETRPALAIPLTEAEQRAAKALGATQVGRRLVGVEGMDAGALRRQALFLAATNTDPDVVAASLRALGDADAASFAPDERTVLREVARRHLGNPDLAGFAAHAALAAYPDVDSDGLQDALVQVLATHRSPGVRAASARALERAPRLRPASIAALQKAALDPYPSVRLAVAGDGTYADRAAVVGGLWPAFRVLLDYHHASVRAAAVRSVGRALGRGDLDAAVRAEVIAALRAKLADRWARVRCAALDAAGASGDRAFVHDAVERLGDVATCDEQPDDAPASPDGMLWRYDGTVGTFPRGPTVTVARAAFDAIGGLMGEELPHTVRDAWEESGLALPRLVGITRRWYAKAKKALPPRMDAGAAR